MTRDEAVTQILKQCGQRQGDTAAQADVINEMVNVQTVLERGPIQPWFLLSLYTDQAFVMSTSTDVVALPGTFLREVDDSVTDVGSLWYYKNDQWKIVYKEDYSIAQRKFGNSLPSTPQRYCLISSDIMLFPPPNEALDLRLLAAFQQTSLAGVFGGAGNVENNWLKYAHDMMISETGKIVAGGYFRDTDAFGYFSNLAVKAEARVYADTVARIEAGILRAMGV